MKKSSVLSLLSAVAYQSACSFTPINQLKSLLQLQVSFHLISILILGKEFVNCLRAVHPTRQVKVPVERTIKTKQRRLAYAMLLKNEEELYVAPDAQFSLIFGALEHVIRLLGLLSNL